jgi:hypothetical protein
MLRKIKKINLLFLIFTFIFFYGCESVKTQYIGPDKIPDYSLNDTEDVIIKISGAFFKNGNFIDLQEKNANIVTEGKIKELIYDLSETKKGKIFLDDIYLLKLTIVKSNHFAGAALIGMLVIVFLIWFFDSLHQIKLG